MERIYEFKSSNVDEMKDIRTSIALRIPGLVLIETDGLEATLTVKGMPFGELCDRMAGKFGEDNEAVSTLREV